MILFAKWFLETSSNYFLAILFLNDFNKERIRWKFLKKKKSARTRGRVTISFPGETGVKQHCHISGFNTDNNVSSLWSCWQWAPAVSHKTSKAIKLVQKLWDNLLQINKQSSLMPFTALIKQFKDNYISLEAMVNAAVHLLRMRKSNISGVFHTIVNVFFFKEKMKYWIKKKINTTPIWRTGIRALTVWASLESLTWLHSPLRDTQRTNSGNCKWQKL